MLQNSITNLHEAGEQYGLSISVKKTKVMFVNMPRPVLLEKLLLGMPALKRSQNLYTWDVKSGMMVLTLGLKAVLWKRREISILTKMKLFNALILSRLLYGSENWTITARDLQRLEAFQTQCLRRMLRISWMSKVTNEEVREKCLQ